MFLVCLDLKWKFQWYVGSLNDDSQPQATKVLMVIGVGVAGRWRLPLCYCLTDGTDAQLQEALLKSIISKLSQCGCCVVSVTMDGLAANQKTLRNLGCNFDPKGLVSIFPHTDCDDMQVAAVFDACHMMKLARNCLNEYQILKIPGVGKVKWEHIKQLHSVQTGEGLTLANKLTKAHVNYKTQKMKVKLAVQVISASCAKAIEYLRLTGSPAFADSLPTELFLRKLDKLFDYLNCRSAFGKGYKSPINAANAAARIGFLEETRQFLLTLENSNGKRLVDTKRRMFVIGLCVTINSVIYLTQKLILQAGINGVKLRYLLTYKMSQDHIEILFSIIRRRGGWCNNPTAMQFRLAYRAILCHVGVVPLTHSNCLTNCTDDILADENTDSSDLFVESAVALQDHCYATLLPTLSKYVENVATYIAGFVVRKLLPRLKCGQCRSLLVDADNINAPSSSFLQLKNNGGLVTPSAAVVRIVHIAERNLRAVTAHDKPIYTIAKLGSKLESMVIEDVDISHIFGHTTHLEDTLDGIENHVSSLTRQVVKFYLQIRKFHIVKSWNISQRGTVVRQKLTKLVLFSNQ